jgi:hypothetical protein
MVRQSSSRGVSRRTMIKQGAGLIAAPLILPSLAFGRTVPASDRVTVGVIGVGMRGRGLLGNLLANPYAQVLAAADVDQWRLNDAKARVERTYAADQKSGQYKGFTPYSDFRDLLARPDLDAVLIATGERWHAVMTVMAAKAGKDVYCEKPVSFTLHESRAMINAIKRYDRVFQGGFQQRSAPEYRKAVNVVRSGRIGPLKTIFANWTGAPTEMNLPAEPVPDTLDWNMWLGPSPEHPFNNRYHHLGQPKTVVPWQNNRDFGTGQMGAGASHTLDIAQWGNGSEETGPVEIVPPSKGGKGTAITYRYGNGVTLYSVQRRIDPEFFEIPEGFDPAFQLEWETLFVCEGGWVMAGRAGRLEAHPREILDEVQHVRPTEDRPYRDLSSQVHVDSWLHAVRMRHEATCGIVSATRSTNIAHLANIAYRTDRTLHFDPTNERFQNDDEANRLRERTLRQPWTLV